MVAVPVRGREKAPDAGRDGFLRDPSRIHGLPLLWREPETDRAGFHGAHAVQHRAERFRLSNTRSAAAVEANSSHLLVESPDQPLLTEEADAFHTQNDQHFHKDPQP